MRYTVEGQSYYNGTWFVIFQTDNRQEAEEIADRFHHVEYYSVVRVVDTEED